jgi:hypothetical protein
MKRSPRSVVIIRSEPALWGAGTPGAGASFWDTVPTPTWAAGNSSQRVPNTESGALDCGRTAARIADHGVTEAVSSTLCHGDRGAAKAVVGRRKRYPTARTLGPTPPGGR